MKPLDIERKSFSIIAQELGDRKLDPEYDLLIRRVIHTTADFEYADSLCFSEHAVLRMKEAIEKGSDIITDTTMAMSGINKKILSRFGEVRRSGPVLHRRRGRGGGGQGAGRDPVSGVHGKGGTAE